MIRHLLGKSTGGIHAHSEPHIIVAHNLTPGDTALINRSLVRGFATEAGSKTSHTAILSRSLNIPAMVGLHDITSRITAGDELLIDGYRGILIVNPTPETIKDYEAYEEEKHLVEERLELIRDTSSTTTDSIHITLSANIELPDEMDDVRESGAEGVGLFRTEYLFLNRDTSPTRRSNSRATASPPSAARPIPSSFARSTSAATRRSPASSFHRKTIPSSAAAPSASASSTPRFSRSSSAPFCAPPPTATCGSCIP